MARHTAIEKIDRFFFCLDILFKGKDIKIYLSFDLCKLLFLFLQLFSAVGYNVKIGLQRSHFLIQPVNLGLSRRF